MLIAWKVADDLRSLHLNNERHNG